MASQPQQAAQGCQPNHCIMEGLQKHDAINSQANKFCKASQASKANKANKANQASPGIPASMSC
jgi:hypothetical protein